MIDTVFLWFYYLVAGCGAILAVYWVIDTWFFMEKRFEKEANERARIKTAMILKLLKLQSKQYLMLDNDKPKIHKGDAKW
jgi:hypothetical protein